MTRRIIMSSIPSYVVHPGVKRQIFDRASTPEKKLKLDERLLAAKNDHPEFIQALQEAGIDLNTLNSLDVNSNNRAHYAAADGNVEIIQLLHKASVNLSKPNINGATPAYYAAANGHVEVIQALHNAGVNLSKPNNNRMTPAHYAAADGHLEVIQVLHDAGVDITIPNNNGLRPEDIAAIRGHLEVAFSCKIWSY